MPSKKSSASIARVLAVVLLAVVSTGCHHEVVHHDDRPKFDHQDAFKPGPGPGGY